MRKAIATLLQVIWFCGAAFAASPQTVASVAALRAGNFSSYPSVDLVSWRAGGYSGGGSFYLVTTDTTTLDNSCTVIVDAAGNRFYRQTAPDGITPYDCGAVGNTKIVSDGAMGSGSATLSSATAPFASSDVGKTISVKGAGAAGAYLITTISGYSSPSSVTLASPNASGGAVSGKVVNWGTNDAVALQAWLDTMAQGVSGYVAAGRYTTAAALTAGSASGSSSFSCDNRAKTSFAGPGDNRSKGPGTAEIVGMLASGSTLTFDGHSPTCVPDPQFVNFGISNYGNASYNLELYNALAPLLENVTIQGANTAEIYVTGTGTNPASGIAMRVLNSKIGGGTGDCVRIDQNAVNDITLEGNEMGCGGYGLYQKGSTRNLLFFRAVNNQFNNNVSGDLNFEGQVAGAALTGNYYEFDDPIATRPFIRFQNGSAGPSGGISIQGNYFKLGLTTGTLTSAITFAHAGDVQVSANFIDGCGGCTITNFVGPDSTITPGDATLYRTSHIAAPLSVNGTLTNTYNNNLGGMVLSTDAISIGTTLYDTVNATNYFSGGNQGITQSCVAAAATLTITSGLITAVSGC